MFHFFTVTSFTVCDKLMDVCTAAEESVSAFLWLISHLSLYQMNIFNQNHKPQGNGGSDEDLAPLHETASESISTMKCFNQQENISM
jgi:hypothetical protein